MKKFFQDIKDHTSSNLMDVYHEQGREAADRAWKWEVIRVTAEHLRYIIGALVCKRFGHSSKTEHEDFVNATRDERGRITDIDGGGVDWFCPRCGTGGRNYF